MTDTRTIEWCKTHRAEQYRPNPDRCWASLGSGHSSPCRFVTMQMTPAPKPARFSVSVSRDTYEVPSSGPFRIYEPWPRCTITIEEHGQVQLVVEARSVATEGRGFGVLTDIIELANRAAEEEE